jgi:hypothetical protein
MTEKAIRMQIEEAIRMQSEVATPGRFERAHPDTGQNSEVLENHRDNLAVAARKAAG